MNPPLAKPKSRSDDLVVESLSHETLVYDLKRHKAHCLNATAAYIWLRCDGKTSVEEIAQGLASEFGLPADPQIVTMALDTLRKARLLESSALDLVPNQSRRQTLKRIGIAAGLAALIPAVTSILAPTAALAATQCAQLNQACSPTVLCCPGLVCVGGVCVSI